MVRLMTLLLMISLLGSCNTVTRQVVCAQIESSRIPNLALCDISFQFNRCRCRCFDINEWETRPLNQCLDFQDEIGDVVDKPIEYCDGIAGFWVEDHAAEIKPRIKKLGAVRDDYCE